MKSKVGIGLFLVALASIFLCIDFHTPVAFASVSEELDADPSTEPVSADEDDDSDGSSDDDSDGSSDDDDEEIT